MNKNKFVNLVTEWYKENSEIKETHTANYVINKLHNLIKSEVDGDFIGETEHTVLGKYYYSLKIEPENAVNGNMKELNFCVYGLGTKENVTEEDYELSDYCEIDYELV